MHVGRIQCLGIGRVKRRRQGGRGDGRRVVNHDTALPTNEITRLKER
jgi:hypothetical protein